MSDVKRKKPWTTIFITIIVTAGVTLGGLYVVGSHIQEQPNLVDNQTNTNNTDIEGNITSVTELKNGTLILSVQSAPSEEKELKYQDNIMNAIKKEADEFSNVCSIQITTKDNNESRVIYEKPNSLACKFEEEPKPIPIPPPIVNETPPIPTPTPTPIEGDKKIIVVGDIGTNTDSKNVFNAIQNKKPDVVALLGDLGYGSDLQWLKSTYGKLNMVCVPGNHESSNEDGTASLQSETQQFCSLPWYFKLNNVLFLGINTNGNLDTQLGQAQEIVMNAKQMQGVKEVHLLTHKPCAVPPNAHHPVESKVKTFCDSLKAKVPTGVKFVNDAGHNHVMSASKDGSYITSGAGGRSHYTCGTSTIFTFCDNVHFGYLEYIIKPDGTSSYKFYDYNGKVIQ